MLSEKLITNKTC